MRPENANATIKNPRWWLALPVLLPTAVVWIGVGTLAYKPMWWIGQALCGLSNAMSPDAPTPTPIKAILSWVRNGSAV